MGFNLFNPVKPGMLGRLSAGLIQLVKKAGGVLYLDARKANGIIPLTGNDSPFVDLSGKSNNGTLTNFEGDVGSGWQASPNMLRFDGIDDFVAFVDSANLDITDAPLAIGITTKNTNSGVYVFIRNEDAGASSESQYALYKGASARIDLYLDSDLKVGTTIDNSEWSNYLFIWDGINIKTYVNCVLDTTTPFVGTLQSFPNTRLGCRSSAIDGTTNTGFMEGDIATLTMYIGSDENKILEAETQISAEYLALN